MTKADGIKSAENHVTLSQLESHLWEAATPLRGIIDAGDFKQFIFPLLFYKRVAEINPLPDARKIGASWPINLSCLACSTAFWQATAPCRNNL
jgi:hypothetical protein